MDIQTVDARKRLTVKLLNLEKDLAEKTLEVEIFSNFCLFACKQEEDTLGRMLNGPEFEKFFTKQNPENALKLRRYKNLIKSKEDAKTKAAQRKAKKAELARLVELGKKTEEAHGRRDNNQGTAQT
jgi:hypothetical protein